MVVGHSSSVGHYRCELHHCEASIIGGPMSMKANHVKVAAPHEFRAQDNRINHYDHGVRKESLLVDIPNTKEGKVLARQIARALNDSFKYGIQWGYNYRSTEKLSDEQLALVFSENDINLGSK